MNPPRNYLSKIYASFTMTVLVAWLIFGFIIFFNDQADLYARRVFIIVTAYILVDKILQRVSLILLKRESKSYRKDLVNLMDLISEERNNFSPTMMWEYEKLESKIQKKLEKEESNEDDKGDDDSDGIKQSKVRSLFNPATWFTSGF